SPDAIGKIGGGRNCATKCVDIAMVQTLARAEFATERLRAYGHVVVDECHHVPAVSIERILSAIPARYVTGLTATPYRRDGLHPILAMQCGPVRRTVTAAAVRRQHELELSVIRRDTQFDASTLPRQASIQDIYGALAADADRLQYVVGDTLDLLNEGRAIMILTERRDHLDSLACALRDERQNVVVLHGGIPIRT